MPAIGEHIADKLVESPNGGEILLTQREAVNDAWDLPVEQTFEDFLETHPKWKAHTKMENQFEWKWYYAFQQVGDQKSALLSEQYRLATQQRDEISGYIAWLSPAMLVQRALTKVAKTDLQAAQNHEQSIREFHRQLREFYYPLLFENRTYDKEIIKLRPKFNSLENMTNDNKQTTR